MSINRCTYYSLTSWKYFIIVRAVKPILILAPDDLFI
ncbi:hypothetical protein OIU77_006146 [Salix suchowensis]|uniref:Uncharacterized protein n=1 Tax=Salix suchowensis TaxID=1278906 RepID=A0ABQ9ATW0_9ROSI|nr:hypothetical protein OIU77_006146 [Salix suchowensis]